MSVEQNLRMVDAAFEAINDRLGPSVGLHVDNIVMSAPDLPDPVKVAKRSRNDFQAWGEPFRISRERVRGFGQGDWVCVELVISGTHKGRSAMASTSGRWKRAVTVSFPHGKRIEIRGCVV